MEAAMDMDTRTVFTRVRDSSDCSYDLTVHWDGLEVGRRRDAQSYPNVHCALKDLGGWTPLNMAVNLFYDKLLADPLLAPFFEGISMEKLRKKQMAFMAFAFGGATTYFGKTVVHAHRKMIKEQGLGLVHFDAVLGHFQATLAELGLPQSVKDEVTAVLMTTRPMFDAQALSKENTSAAVQDQQLQQRLLQLQKGNNNSAASAGSEGGCPSGNGNGSSKPASKATTQLADRLRVSTLVDILGPILSSKKGKGSSSAKCVTKSVPASAGISENGALPDLATTANASHQTPGQDSTPSQSQEMMKSANGTDINSACGKTATASSNVVDDAAKEAKRARRQMLKQMIKDLDNLPTAASSGLTSASKAVSQTQNVCETVGDSIDVNASSGRTRTETGQHNVTTAAAQATPADVNVSAFVKSKPTINSAPSAIQPDVISVLSTAQSSPSLAIKHISQHSSGDVNSVEGASGGWASPSAVMSVYHNTRGLQLDTNQSVASDGSGDSSGIAMPADSDDELQQQLANRQSHTILRTGSTGRSSRFSRNSLSKDPGAYVDDEYVGWHPAGLPSVAAVHFANLSTLSEVSETERDSSLGVLVPIVRNSTTSPS